MRRCPQLESSKALGQPRPSDRSKCSAVRKTDFEEGEKEL